MFLALVGVAVAPFDCMAGGAGTSYMRSSPDMACDQDTGGDASDIFLPYNVRVVLGGFALSCCIAAIVLIAIALRCGRAKLHSDELFMRTYGALYLRYDEGAYYWEVLILLRKLLLVLITKVLSSNQPAQIAGCAVVLGGALVLQYRVKPFLSDALDALEEHTLAACMAIVVLGICSQLGMPPIAVTVLYAAIMLASAVVIGRGVRAVWAEGSEPEAAKAAEQQRVQGVQGRIVANTAGGAKQNTQKVIV